MRPTRAWASPLHLAIAAVAGLAGCLGAADGQVEHGNVAFAVSPDGKQVAFSAADGDLYLLTLEGRRVQRLTETDVAESSPSFSPDGKSVAYSSAVKGGKGARIFLRSLDGKEVRQVTDTADVSDAMPSFSPDGSRVAFARAHRNRPYSMGGWTWDQCDVCVIDRDGTNLRRLTRQGYYATSGPCFVDEGKALCFAGEDAGPDNSENLFSVPVDGSSGPKAMMTARPADLKCGSWASGPSPSGDGKQVAFISDRLHSFRYDIWVINGDGNGARPLGVTSVGRYNKQPRFLPDGSRLMFLAGTTSNAGNRPIFGLWSVGLDGTRPVEVADSNLFTDPTRWPAPPRPAKP